MFCTKCGKQLDNTARFCSACGNPVSVESPETPVTAETEEPAVPETPAIAETEEPVAPKTPVIAETEEPAVPETPVTAETEAPAAPETPVTAETEEPAAPKTPAIAETVEPAVPETPAIVETEEPAAPETPAIAETEEPAAPETPVIAETAPVSPAAAETVEPEPPTVPPAPTFDEFARENPAPKKKKRLAPWIAGGTAAVLAGTSAVGWFGFRNQALRLFLGDAGFALRIEQKTGEFLSFDESASSALIEAFTARINEATALQKQESADEEYEDAEIRAMIAEIRALTERFGGSEVAYGLSIEPDVLLNSLLGLSGEVGDLLAQVGRFRGVLRAESDENADRVEFSAEYDGEEIAGGTLTLDPGKLVMTAPALSGYTFFTDYTEPTDPTGEADVTVSAGELGRLGGTVVALYYEALAEAEFTYEDGSFPVAGRTVEGTRIRAELSVEQMNALYQRIADTIRNDEYLREHYRVSVGEDMSEYDALFNKPIVFSAPLVVESYIGANETLLAKAYSCGIAGDEDESGKIFTLEYANPDGDDSLRIGTSDGIRFGFDRRANAETEEDDGTVEFSYAAAEEEDAPTLVLALDYVRGGTAELCGEPIPLGTYTLRLSEKDTMLRSLLLGVSADDPANGSPTPPEEEDGLLAVFNTILERFTLTVSVQAIGDGEETIRTDLTLSLGDYLSVSAYLEQKPLESAGEPIVIPPTDGEKCVDLRENRDEATETAIKIDLYENLLRRIDENGAFAKLTEQLGLKEEIEKALAEERGKLEFMAHYADYSDVTRFRADNVARSIKYEFDSEYWDVLLALNEDGSENEKWGTEELTKTIRLYFGENGETTVLDDGGLGYLLDFDELVLDEDRKNLYCEILFSAYGEQPNGVTVVCTDDPNDLPEGLPTAYHYIDGVYEWDGEDNAVGAYIVGTSPTLAEGVSTAEERLRAEREEQAKEKEELDALNDAAKRLNSAVNGFLRTNPSFFRPDVSIATAIVRYDEDAGWVVDSLTGVDNEITGASDLFPEGVSAVGKLAEHLNRRFPEFTPVKAQIHFAREYDFNLGDSENMSAIGTGVIAADARALFQDGGLPWALSFWLGYEPNWNGNNPAADPEAGYYWLDYNTCILFGSYCALTDAPLAIDAYETSGDMLESEVETLNEYARRLAAVAAPYAAEHDLVKKGQVLYSLVLTNKNGRWRFENAYTNNYRLSDSDGIDRAAIEGLVAELNAGSAAGTLRIAREITAELHFFDDGGFVGAGTTFVTSDLDVTGVHVPGSWDYKNGYFYDWNAFRRDEENRPGVYYKDNYTAIPFGSYCAVSDAPLGLYEPIGEAD